MTLQYYAIMHCDTTNTHPGLKKTFLPNHSVPTQLASAFALNNFSFLPHPSCNHQKKCTTQNAFFVFSRDDRANKNAIRAKSFE
jgi:hypothetical protein